MTNLSPFLRNHIAQPNNSAQLDNTHEKIYQDLQKRAHEAKPNEAKAKMVKQGPIGSAVSSVIDTGKDCVNFTTAVRTKANVSTFIDFYTCTTFRAIKTFYFHR